jgi:hypothetical protein
MKERDNEREEEREFKKISPHKRPQHVGHETRRDALGMCACWL